MPFVPDHGKANEIAAETARTRRTGQRAPLPNQSTTETKPVGISRLHGGHKHNESNRIRADGGFADGSFALWRAFTVDMQIGVRKCSVGLWNYGACVDGL